MKKFNLRKAYSMKKNKDIEQILLNDAAFEQAVKSKIEQDFKNTLENAKNLKEKSFITDIKDVPPRRLFSKDTTFEVINKNSKTKSYINGIQAEGYLGTNVNERNKLLAGEVDSFVAGSYFVKFIKIKV